MNRRLMMGVVLTSLFGAPVTTVAGTPSPARARAKEPERISVVGFTSEEPPERLRN